MLHILDDAEKKGMIKIKRAFLKYLMVCKTI